MTDYSKFSNYYVPRDGTFVIGKNGRISVHKDKNGYSVFSAYDDTGKRKTIKLHRLVATRYIPTGDCSLTVNHIDGNKDNNDASNLEWISSSDNLRHSWNTLGRVHFTKKVVNSNGEIFDSLKDAAEKFGVKIASMSNCCNGRTKSCCGLKWGFYYGK